MGNARIAQRYARALLKNAQASGNDLSAVLPALEAIEALYEFKEIHRFLENPVMPLEVKRLVIDYALQKADASGDLKKFTDLVLEVGRVEIFPLVATAYRKMIHNLKGVEDGVVRSRVPIPEASMETLTQSLSQSLGKKVTLRQVQDKALLGGFLVEIGNYRVDQSLKNIIEEMAENANH